MNKLLLLSFLFMANTGSAQSVESSSYQFMLKNLLERNVKEISVDEAHNRMDLVFVDAREKKEFDVSHILGSVWVGYEEQDLTALQALDTSQNIVVYCSVGYRSEKTVQKLNQLGYQNVYNLYGGIFEWKNREFPVYRQEKETDKVHAYSRIWGVWLKKGEKIYD